MTEGEERWRGEGGGGGSVSLRRIKARGFKQISSAGGGEKVLGKNVLKKFKAVGKGGGGGGG